MHTEIECMLKWSWHHERPNHARSIYTYIARPNPCKLLDQRMHIFLEIILTFFNSCNLSLHVGSSITRTQIMAYIIQVKTLFKNMSGV
jgi:hypothetical protein